MRSAAGARLQDRLLFTFLFSSSHLPPPCILPGGADHCSFSIRTGALEVSPRVFFFSFFFPLKGRRQEGCGGSDPCLFCAGGPVSELVSAASHQRGPVLTSLRDNLLFCGRVVVDGAVHLVGRRSCETALARRVLVCLTLPLPFFSFSKWQYLKQA